MVRTSTGKRGDTCRESFHMEMQNAIRKTKTPEGGFGRIGILTKEQFVRSCELAEKMSALARGRW